MTEYNGQNKNNKRTKGNQQNNIHRKLNIEHH